MKPLAVLCLALAACGPLPAATDGGAPRTYAGGETVSLRLQPFTIPPGAEVYKCQDFANPFGADVDVAAFRSHLTPGSHHLLVFYKAGATDGALEDCSGFEFAAGPYGSQRPDDEIVYPAGVGAAVAHTTGFRVQVHYLNASHAPLAIDTEVAMQVARPGSVAQHAAVFFFNNTQLSIPPTGQPVTIGKTCTVPTDIEVLQATGHMHAHGVRFTATAAGTTLFDSSSYADVQPALFDPPLHLAAGTAVTFSCTYVNDTGAAIRFGESARGDEMCILSGQFFPASVGFGCL